MQPSQTILTVAKILSLFTSEKEEVSVREVSKILDFYPSRVHRLLASLELCGFLEKDSNHRYRLGEAILELGSLYPLHLPLRKVARPHAEELARKYKTHVQVAIPSRIRAQWDFGNLFRPPADGNSFESNVRREVP
jgi:DNA-binding IclR family transcriptional regulator